MWWRARRAMTRGGTSGSAAMACGGRSASRQPRRVAAWWSTSRGLSARVENAREGMERMGRLRRFADSRFVGLRDDMRVYDCDDEAQYELLARRGGAGGRRGRGGGRAA